MVTAIIVSAKDGTAREINNNEGGRQEEAQSSSVMAVGSVKNNYTAAATAAAASRQPSQQQQQPIKRGPGRPTKPLPPNIKKRGRGRPPKSSYSPAELAAQAARKEVDAKTKTLEGKRKRVTKDKDMVPPADIKQHAGVQQKMSKNLEQEVNEMLNSVPNITSLKKSNHFGQRGITLRPSGKWQVQYFWCGKSRYIGVFPSKEDAFAAYEVTRKIFEKEEPLYIDPVNEIADDVAVNKRLKVVRMAVFSALSKINKK